MKIIEHIYSLTPEWQYDLAKDMGAQLIDDKIMVLPHEIGIGQTYFTEIIDGISVLLIDYVSTAPMEVNRLRSDNELYILHYDLSDEVNLIKIENIHHKIGYSINLGLAVLNNQLDNSFRPVVGKRTFALRVLVDKKLLNSYIKINYTKEDTKKKIKIGKRMLFFYDHIDSNSKLMIHSLKNKSIYDQSFEFYIKGVTLKLVANFVSRYSNMKYSRQNIKENEMMIATKDYLLNNLYDGFPSINFLADMAGMSVAKYNLLFKKFFLCAPKQFFIREKMILAKVLLMSESFMNITEVMRELNYSKLTYFSQKYYAIHQIKPIQDFLRKQNDNEEGLTISSPSIISESDFN